MKRKTLHAVVITGLLVLAVSAYAADTVTLSHPVMLNGKQLDAGEYQVKVNSRGDVTFLRGKTEVLTTKARLEDRDSKARFDTVVTRANGSDVPSITEIQFEGKKKALVFDNSAQASNQH